MELIAWLTKWTNPHNGKIDTDFHMIGRNPCKSRTWNSKIGKVGCTVSDITDPDKSAVKLYPSIGAPDANDKESVTVKVCYCCDPNKMVLKGVGK